MTEDIKSLLAKIQRDGVEAAQNKALQIEVKAQHEAAAIKEKAEAGAAKLLLQAKERIAKDEANSKELLQQASRDMLITLRKAIEDTLNKIITNKLQEALTPEELAKIITNLVKDYAKQAEGDIIITLKKEDLERLEKGLLSALKNQLSKGIVLHRADDLQAGFRISYDADKSHYDFSDQALAGYITGVIKPKLNALLKNV